MCTAGNPFLTKTIFSSTPTHQSSWSSWQTVQASSELINGSYTTRLRINNEVGEVTSTQTRTYQELKLFQTPYYKDKRGFIDSNIRDFIFTFTNSPVDDTYPPYLDPTDLVVESTDGFLSVKTIANTEYRFGHGEFPKITLNDDKGSIFLEKTFSFMSRVDYNL